MTVPTRMPPLRSTLLICLGLLAGAAQADDQLTGRIQPGQWRFNADREAEISALGYHKRDRGASMRCLGHEPLAELRDWLARKGCQVQETGSLPAGMTLRGECRFRFLPGMVLPMEGEIAVVAEGHFTLRLTAGHTGLSYREETVAERLGDCPEGVKP